MPRSTNASFGVVVTSEGTHAVMTALRELPNDARKELAEANEKVSGELALRLKAAGLAQGRQARLVASTVRAKRGQRPSVEAGGNEPLGRHHTPAGRLLIGSEFGHSGKGGKGKGSRDFAPHGFRPRKSSGYWWYPTLERENPKILEVWQGVADEIVRKWGSQ